MKKSLFFSILVTFTLLSLYSKANSQSWELMMDSTLYYLDNSDIQSSMKWAKLSLAQAEKEFGKDTNYAESLGYVSRLFYNLGQIDSAVYYGENLVKLDSILYKSDCSKKAENLNNLAYFKDNKGLYLEAELLYKEALAIRRRLYDGDNPEIATSINNLAVFYNMRKKFQEAETLYKESLAMSRRLYTEDNRKLAIGLNSMAYFYHTQDKYSEAEPLYKEALEMNRRLFKGDSPDLATTIINMASFYNSMGNYYAAEPLFMEGLAMFKRLKTGDQPKLAQTIQIVADFFSKRGRYAEAEPLYKEALEMRRRLFNSDHSDLAWSIMKMAEFYKDWGNFAQAEPLFKEGIEMFKRLYKEDHAYIAYTMNSLALFYNEGGRYAEAEPLFNGALAMCRRLEVANDKLLAILINSSAFFYHGRDQFDKAEPLYIEALEMSRRLYKEDNIDLGVSIINMASLYFSMDKNDEAEKLYIEGIDMYRRLFKVDHPKLAAGLYILARFYYGLSLYSKSEPLFKESKEMRERLFNSDHPLIAKSTISLAKNYWQNGNVTGSEPLFVNGLNIYIKMLKNYFPSLSENEKKQFWNTVSYSFEGFNTYAIKRSEKNPGILKDMYNFQLYTKGLLFNSTSKIKNRIMNSNDSTLIEKYKELTDKRDFLVKLYSMTENERLSKGFEIDLIEKSTNDLEKELSLKSELYSLSNDLKNVTWDSVQKSLKPGEAAVETVRFRISDKVLFKDTVYYAFLILTDNTIDNPELIVLDNGNKLENQYYNEYRENIKDRKADLKSYGRYWGKLDKKLKGYKKVYFSPDGVYNKLNPETLLMPGGKYLLEEKSIHQINSTRDLIIGYNNSNEDIDLFETAVLIGNPNFSLSEDKVQESVRKMKSKDEKDDNSFLLANVRGINLSELPGTEREIKGIEKLLIVKNIKVETYLGNMALKTAVKGVSNPGILHIATHGMFLTDVKKDAGKQLGFEESKLIENPLLRSGLFFTGAENYLKMDPTESSGNENGLLTAYEAMNLNLDQTELVVLSACETGLGEIINGEGVYGLRRAFQQAGAHSIIMSLWTVNDEATQELMTKFYSNWVSGMAKREAFKKAQIEIKSKYKDPYFWGAFVMVGE